MTSTTEKKKQARKLLAESRAMAVRAERLLDGHAARIFAARAVENLYEALERLQEPTSKEGQ
jgi:hypothetical protein